MIGNLVRVSDSKLDELHANPESILSFLYPDAFSQSKPGLLARLFGSKPKAPKHEVTSTIDECDQTDIDKSWHAIHFLLTDSDWDGDFPNCFLVSGGRSIGDVDVGYGPSWSFTSTETSDIHSFLLGLSNDELKSRLDLARMKQLEIYPQIWNEDSMEEHWEYILWGLDTAREFVSTTCSKSMGLIVYIN